MKVRSPLRFDFQRPWSRMTSAKDTGFSVLESQYYLDTASSSERKSFSGITHQAFVV